ncbi:MAG: pyridoxal phosphate-dependent aminotransferase family protein [candidate division KSB1 bacterium]|nr:pyridoxal phosphate-dependent aminotransferase family protein [candidate division KSB1 bacterium]
MADLFEKCSGSLLERVKQVTEQGLYPYFKAIESGADTSVTINGQELIMIGSNNYLGLTQHPKVKEAAINAIENFGTGCTGSRFLNGTLSLHEELENRLADFMQKEAVLLFSTGFQTNQGFISTIIGRKDFVVGDAENHASIVEGTRLAFGKALKYKHNDMQDLDRVLTNNLDGRAALIISDGVFSMGGDIVNLPELVKVAEKHNVRVMMDDAHSVGVLGAHGRGTAEHFGLEDKVDVTMGTFSKSFASIGGFIAGPKQVIDFVKHESRALIFSASPPPSAVATVLACLDVLEQEPERRDRLWNVTEKMKKGFDDMGFNTGNSQTPIIPIIIGSDEDTFAAWKALYEAGIFVNASISPAVPPGWGLLRTSYMATHSDDELDKVLDIFYKVGKQLGLVK